MKRYSLFYLILSLFITIPAPAFAQTTAPTESLNPTTAVVSTTPTSDHGKSKLNTKAANQADRLTALKQKADEMIQNRVDALNKTLSRINSDKNLSSDEKTQLTTEINGVITGLNTLKTKIDADTDLATARADAKQIVDSYHVFMILEPQTQLLLLIDNLNALDTKITTLLSQAQKVVDAQKAAGKDTTAEQAALDDATAQLQTVATKLAADKTSVLNVKLTDASGHATLVTVRKDLASVRQLFAKVRADLAQFRSDLKGDKTGDKGESAHAGKKPKLSGTPTLAPSGGPTVAPSGQPTTAVTATPTP